MVPMVIQLPEDLSGTSINNKVASEPHELLNRRVRVFAPYMGAFFADSMVLVDTATGKELTKDQYKPAEYYEMPSARAGKKIYAIVLITDPTVSSNVEATYQALGGPMGTSAQAIVQQIEALKLDERPVAWPDILGKDSEFTPSHHLHDIGDTYGWEYIVHAIERLRASIELGDAYANDALLKYVDRGDKELQDQLTALKLIVDAHVNNFENVHKVTAHQTGAYTQAEVDQMLSDLNSRLRSDLGITVAERTAPYTLVKEDVGKWLRIMNTGAVTVPAGVFAKNDLVYLRAASGPVTIVGDGTMVVNLPTGQNNTLHGTGCQISLTFLSGTEVDLTGATRYV